MQFDCDISAQDIQELASADAVAAFFARLGYHTDVRMDQSPGNLGLTAEGVTRPIKRIELVADQESLLQVYLFELTSVTVTHTRALARAFRNRAGNYLLVLTSDYDRLDFVLIEKYLPPAKDTARTITQQQVGVRARPLTVERRKPQRVHLRVLRRFTYTETDPLAQYDKLLSAYAIADWSEEFFNNRALFSDYYLLERLRDRPEWTEDPKPAYTAMRQVMQGASGKFAGQPEEQLRQGLLEPALQALGFAFRAGKKADSALIEPDYRLFGPDEKKQPLAVCLAYPWARSLDSKDDQRDKQTPDENPGAVVVSLLERGEAPWAVVTNGKVWRLYSQRTHSRATNYYEIDLEEVLADIGPGRASPADPFRYFWLLFRRQAFEPTTIEREGKVETLCFLDLLLAESQEYAKELGERLKDRVFEHVFPHLAEGFITHIRQRDAKDADLSQDALDVIFQGTLTLLYRLLFLLYAEARDLLPVKEVRGYFEASVRKLKAEIAEAAGPIADEVEKKLNKQYREERYDLYGRFTHLCGVVDQGDAAVNVPVYNGGLFLSDPHDDDDTPEARNARFLNATRVPDRHLARAVDLLARDVDPKRHDLVFIDFKSLGVRQLGSIYEGLLEFRLRVAPEKMAVVQGKKTEEVVPYGEAKSSKRKILTHGRGKDAKERVLRKGTVYLENDKRERRASGSYYTPDHVVKYIVKNTVGPVLQQKFEAVRPAFREAEQKRKAFFTREDAFRKKGLRPEPDSKADEYGREAVDRLFDIKVLDPAMGSGHFLVEAVDFITDKVIPFLSKFGWNPVTAHLGRMRQTILEEMDEQGITIDAKRLTDVNLLKRHVLKRCVYGVDLNPMAVELAKVSLWLDCFTLGAPLSFLDHHLRCGNSLIGVTVEEARETLEGKRGTKVQRGLFGSRFAGLLLATDLMRHVGELSDVTSAQVRQSRAEYRKASEALGPFKRILDTYTSQWFGNAPKTKGRRRKTTEQADIPPIAFLKDPEAEAFINARDPKALASALASLSDHDREIARTALQAADMRRFFHWELEFPEVFYGPRPGSTQAIDRIEGAGFDAVIGNPPYDVLASEELGYDVSQDLAFYETLPVYAPAIRGKKNLYKLFVCRAAATMGRSGSFSFIVPMVLLGDQQAAGVRRMLLENTGLVAVDAFPQKDDPRNRVFPEAKLATCVFATQAEPSDQPFTVRTHPGRWIEGTSHVLRVRPSEIVDFDPENAAVPSCTQEDWDLAVRLLSGSGIQRMHEVATSFQGEVNETNERKRGTLTDRRDAPVVLRGANVCMYAVREASQGEEVRLNVRKFLEGRTKGTKAFAHRHTRAGFQRSSPQNNFRRIIATRIGRDSFCIDTISYVTDESSQIDLDLLVALLNSKIFDWYFRLGSTNSKVNEYQFNALPVPSLAGKAVPLDRQSPLGELRWPELGSVLCGACTEPGVMPPPVAEALAAMSRRIQEIEAKRVLKTRAERSRLAPESQPIQDAIDRVLFRCYGLSEDEAQYVEKRLEEML